MKKILPILLVLAAMFSFTAFSENATTITMSTWLAAEDGTKAIYQEMLDDFMKANPDIKVEVVALPFNQTKDQVLLAGGSGEAADVIMGNSQMMGAFNAAGLCATLDELLSPELIEDIYPGYLSGTTYDGEIRAVSWAPHPIVLYYNVELFEKAGLDPKAPPSTWEETIEYARKITELGQDENGNVIYGLGIPTAKVTYSATALNGILYAFGGRFLDENGMPAIVNDGNIKVFETLKNLTDEKILPKALEIKDLRGLFATGQVGMLFDSDAGLAAIRAASGIGAEFDKGIDVAICPVGETGRSETVYTEHQLAVYAQSDKKEAAVRLVEYLVGPEAMVKYHDAVGTLSARKSVSSLPEMNLTAFDEVFNKQSETASPLPAANPMFDSAMNEMTKAMERVIIAGEDVKTVLEETQEILVSMYE
ncbi:MAG: extracellular solute-binding protein [Eubacteriales bacterium]|nr:extracellular solute-binding protein [Eubacteriales bacterium]